MRGTEYAIGEVILWMLVALVIGILIGWILRGLFGSSGKLKEVEEQLEDLRQKADALSAELGDRKQHIAGLESELSAKAAELEAKEGELSGSQEMSASLEAQLGEARASLESSQATATELESRLGSVTTEKDAEIARLGGEVAGVADMQSTLADRDARVADLEGKVEELEAKASDLSGRLTGATQDLSTLREEHAGCAVTADENAGRIAALESTVSGRDQRIQELEAELAAAVAAREAAEAAVPAKPAWQQGTTSLGTPGAAHNDDLKVINGIGPKLEALLNSFGIQSWEQLAALTPADVATVDGALEEFPGRIERDAWVSQAADLVARYPDMSDRPDRTTYLNER